MRRIDYKDQEYLVHTRSGMTVKDAIRELGVPVECDCDGTTSSAKCEVRWPKDTQFLLTAPTELERTVLGDKLQSGYRLSCQAMFK